MEINLEKLRELERNASPGPWDTINFEEGCPNFGYCTQEGCFGHKSDVAYDVDGPMLLRDGEVGGVYFNNGELQETTDEEEQEEIRQANADANFIATSRNVFRALLDEIETLRKQVNQ